MPNARRRRRGSKGQQERGKARGAYRRSARAEDRKFKRSPGWRGRQWRRLNSRGIGGDGSFRHSEARGVKWRMLAVRMRAVPRLRLLGRPTVRCRVNSGCWSSCRGHSEAQRGEARAIACTGNPDRRLAGVPRRKPNRSHKRFRQFASRSLARTQRLREGARRQRRGRARDRHCPEV